MYLLTALCIITAVISAALGIKIYLIKKSAREISQKLTEKLETDTNTLIDISCGDRDMRNLASQLNVQLRRLREERCRLENGDREIREAVTNISHDLRTPLTAISGYLDLAESEEKSDNLTEYLSIIRGRTNAMRQLTEELFRYSVAAAGNGLYYEKLDLGTLLEETLAEFYGAISGRGIEPVIDLPDISPVRSLDRTALKRVLGNILGNAVKYSSGDLTVRLDMTGKMTFSNTAPDLDPLLAARLFDRFYTARTGNNSTGLGLSIAKLLTEQMGGEISAAYAGKTLTVTLFFPGEE